MAIVKYDVRDTERAVKLEDVIYQPAEPNKQLLVWDTKLKRAGYIAPVPRDGFLASCASNLGTMTVHTHSCWHL